MSSAFRHAGQASSDCWFLRQITNHDPLAFYLTVLRNTISKSHKMHPKLSSPPLHSKHLLYLRGLSPMHWLVIHQISQTKSGLVWSSKNNQSPTPPHARSPQTYKLLTVIITLRQAWITPNNLDTQTCPKSKSKLNPNKFVIKQLITDTL